MTDSTFFDDLEAIEDHSGGVSPSYRLGPWVGVVLLLVVGGVAWLLLSGIASAGAAGGCGGG